MPRPPFERPPLRLQTTTLWEYPSQHYGTATQGDKDYAGATPSWVIWNLLQRYTGAGDTVLDPMCGSGTTLDVCKDTGRRGLGFDLTPHRADVQPADARKLPVADESVDFVFLDPPYSTHVKYSDDARCIGNLDARERLYFVALEQVFSEVFRVLKCDRHMALYVCDSFKKGRPFVPLGFDLFARLKRHFEPVDVVCVVRHNRTLKRGHWHASAAEGNYFLRGFNYLLIMKKVCGKRRGR